MCRKALISRDLQGFKGGIPMLIILSNAVNKGFGNISNGIVELTE